jgi:mRNA interferase MazF
MVTQGAVITLFLDSAKGHEQHGRRPAVIVSNDAFNKRFSVTLVCPITSADRGIPSQIKLDERMKTAGVILTDQIKAIDLNAREYRYVEPLPDDLLAQTLTVLRSFLTK